MRKLKNEELDRLSVKEYQQSQKMPVTVVLDNIRSMHNVGSVFRTADGFRVERVVLCGFTPQPPHRDINKTALGATESVPWEYVEDIRTVVNDLQIAGYKVIAVEQADKSTPLQDYQPRPAERIALIFGNEVEGVDEDIIALCDTVIEIPQFGTKHSFNISVSAGMVLWEVWRKLSKPEQ